MSRKIRFVNIVAEEAAGPLNKLIKSVLDKTILQDTTYDIVSISPAMTKTSDFKYECFAYRNHVGIVSCVEQAEKEGFDGCVVLCFFDPAIRYARQLVKIPVFGLGESTLHLACMMGYRYAIISLNEKEMIPTIEEEIRSYGLGERAIKNPVRLLSMSTKDVFKKGLGGNTHEVISDVIMVAKEAVNDGAEVIVIGCAGLGPMCTSLNVSSIEERKIPILDCLTVTTKSVEMMIDIMKKTGVPVVSRGSFYSMPHKNDIDRINRMFCK